MFQSLPGFRDFFPEDCAVRNHLFKVWRTAAASYCFSEYDAPVLEPLELFTEKSGEEIVTQLFNFVDKGERAVSLRPEMTPSLCRMVGTRAASLKRPIRWFSIGEQFRYERQQKGRLRSFYQFNADIFGEEGPVADAEIVALAVSCLTRLGLGHEDFKVRLSDRTLWFLFLEALGSPTEKIPAVLGVVDKMERTPRAKTEELLSVALGGQAEGVGAKLDAILAFSKLQSLSQIEEFLAAIPTGDELRARITSRLDNWHEWLFLLESFGVAPFVHVDLGIVRGLAYYTGFVFEVFQTVGEGRALAGGGRYDNLVKKLGGPELVATGFAMGDVTLRDLLELKGILPKYVHAPLLYVVASGAARSFALNDTARFRQAGYPVDFAYKDNGFGKQLKQAAQSGARIALIYGEAELQAGNIKVKDLTTRVERDFPREAITDWLPSVVQDGLEPEVQAPGSGQS